MIWKGAMTCITDSEIHAIKCRDLSMVFTLIVLRCVVLCCVVLVVSLFWPIDVNVRLECGLWG